MIPKLIHYCWFGGKPLPKSAKKCIASWKKFFPEFEIKEWNESNFDINACAYTRDAAAQKKWAFVSDYARIQILYEYGGLYFDTDVEVIAPFDIIMNAGNFLGLECDDSADIGSSTNVNVALGLGMGFEAGASVLRDLLHIYRAKQFILSDGSTPQETVVTVVNSYFESKGLVKKNEFQIVEGVRIYPSDYFDPYKAYTKEMCITENTKSVHYYNASWFPLKLKIKKKAAELLGPQGVRFVSRLKNK